MEGAGCVIILFPLRVWAPRTLSSRCLDKKKRVEEEWREGEKECKALLPLLQDDGLRHLMH